MPTPVLDLRPTTDRECERAASLVVTPAPDRLPVRTGTAHGFTVEAQGNGLGGGHNGVLLRITAPDGRVANLIGVRREFDRDLLGQVADSLSPAIRAVLSHRRLSPARAAAGAEAMARVVATTERCLSEQVRGTQALIRVAAAAEGLDPAMVAPFDATTVLASRFGRGDVAVWQVARMIRAGLTVEDAHEWFGSTLRCSSAREFDRRMKIVEAFADAGWTTGQVRAMREAEARRAVEVATATGQPYGGVDEDGMRAWASMPWQTAVVALRAGLSGQAAARLRETGEWDEPTLSALGALRNETIAS